MPIDNDSDQAAADRPRILFVDDEPKVLDAHRRSFRSVRERWSMLFAATGMEALEIMAEQPVDVVISDLAMPKMTGLQLAAKVRDRHPETRFIVLTGTADMQAALDAINEADIFRFYLKPSPADDLIRGISDAIASLEQSKNRPPVIDLGRATLDTLPYGVVVVDEDARVLFVNAFASDLIGAKDGLSLDRNRILRTNSPQQSEQLHKAIAAASTSEGIAADAAFFIERDLSDKPLYCLVRTFVESGEDAEQLRHASLFITDPARAPRVSADTLAGLFELTLSEARLLSCLVASGHLDQAAEDANLTISTARTYLKQIFSKTGTGKQGELIQTVLLSPAILRQAS